jgi:hypothetical protein
VRLFNNHWLASWEGEQVNSLARRPALRISTGVAEGGTVKCRALFVRLFLPSSKVVFIFEDLT